MKFKIKKTISYCLFFIMGCTHFVWATEVNLSLKLDNYPAETTWDIKNSSGTIIESGGSYAVQGELIIRLMDLNPGQYTFNIYDSFGDGICCSYGSGFYTLTNQEDGSTLANGGDFEYSESTSFSIGSNSTAFDDVSLNCTNYTLPTIATGIHLAKYITIDSEIDPSLNGVKILRLGSEPNNTIGTGFMRIIVPPSGELKFAAFQDIDFQFFPYNSRLNLVFTKGVKAFKVKEQVPNQDPITYYHFIYTVTLPPGSDVFIQTRKTGPFLLANHASLNTPDPVTPQNTNFRAPTDTYYNNNYIACAHRGWWLHSGIPENNTLAFDEAFTLDNSYMTMIEVDVAFTKDNIPVLMHDASVERLTNFWDNAPEALKKTNINKIYYFQKSIDDDPNYPYAQYGPLKNAKLKDRFGTVLPDSPQNHVNTLEEALIYFRNRLTASSNNKFVVALDKVTSRMNEAFGIVLLTEIENYVLFKGNGGTYTPEVLEHKVGHVMSQTMYTPYFFSETPNLQATYNAFLAKENLEQGSRWFIPAMEIQIKTDHDHAPSFKKAGNAILTNLIADLRSKNKWVGITPVWPSRCNGVDLKTLYDNCTEQDLLDPLKASSCSNYDWRADMAFAYKNKLNYWITDRPAFTIDFLKNVPYTQSP